MSSEDEFRRKMAYNAQKVEKYLRSEKEEIRRYGRLFASAGDALNIWMYEEEQAGAETEDIVDALMQLIPQFLAAVVLQCDDADRMSTMTERIVTQFPRRVLRALIMQETARQEVAREESSNVH